MPPQKTKPMKLSLTTIALCIGTLLCAQAPDAWDKSIIYTADNATWLSADEKEMIAELNRIRTNPKAYAEIIHPRLKVAKEKLRKRAKAPAATAPKLRGPMARPKSEKSTITPMKKK